MAIMAIIMAFIGHVFQKTCKGTKKYAHTQVTNIFFLKKIDFIYPTTTPLAHWELVHFCFTLTPKIPRRYPEDRYEKMVTRILVYFHLFGGYLLPNLWRHPTHQTSCQLLNIFNIFNNYTITLLHQFMSEFLFSWHKNT